MLGGTDAAFVAIALAMFLKKENKIFPWTKNYSNEYYNTHAHTYTYIHTHTHAHTDT
jgi:hypothetical protein